MIFHPSDQSTIGVEWEVALIDPETRELASRADEVLALLQEQHPQVLEAAPDRAHITG